MHTKLLLRTQLSIRPQLVVSSELLHLPGSDLAQFVQRELDDNPALELANNSDYIGQNLRTDPTRYTVRPNRIRNSSHTPKNMISPDEIVENIVEQRSPIEKLVEQVMLIAENTDRDLTISLLHRLDGRGFLVTPVEQLADDLRESCEAINRGIKLLHQLEPPGIGARSICECFLIQCTYLESQGMDCGQVRRILTIAWNEFLNQKWDQVARKIKQPKGVVEDACEFMRQNFYPHPLALLDTAPEPHKILNHADLVIRRNHNNDVKGYSLDLPGEEEFELRFSTGFQELLDSTIQGEGELSVQEKTWLQFHVERASMIIAALKQRWQTLRNIGEYLMDFQNDFLEHGARFLKPLTRADVAQKLNIHESTVSRAVSHKIVQLPNGRLIPLRDFFDASLATKEAIRQLIKNNPKRLCDQKIAEELQAIGMHLSRRTVTKYRHEINVDSSRRRSLAI